MQYFYQVHACRAADSTNSLYSTNTSGLTSPCTLEAPYSLTADAASCSQINLTWVDNAANETGYFIERSSDGILNWTEVAFLPVNSTVYQDNGLSCQTEYFYLVRAYRQADEQYSQYSGSASAQTSPCAFTLYLPMVLNNPP